MTDSQELTSFIDKAKHARSLLQKLLWFNELLCRIREAKPEWQAALFSRVLDLIESSPENSAGCAQIARSILLECRVTKLLSETGIPQEDSPARESLRRARALLRGSDFEDFDLSDWLKVAFRSESDFAWLRSEEAVVRVVYLLEKNGGLGPRAREQLQGNLLLALLRIAVTCEDVLPEETTFLELRGKLESLEKSGLLSGSTVASCLHGVESCQRRLQSLREEHSTHGDAQCLYRLERARQLLDRVELLLKTTVPHEASHLIRELARALVIEKDILGPIKRSFFQTAKNITFRTGSAGERFVARTRQQYLKLLLAGAGGGFITFFTVLAKSWTLRLDIPVFLIGAMSAMNYAISFLLIYVLGFKLVTKQPAIVASALVKVLGRPANLAQRCKPLRYRTAILRSLATTAITNVAIVGFMVVAFHFAYRALHHGQGFLDAASAAHVIQCLHPFRSLTIPAAALTGVLLWFSSMVGGWFEDRAVRRSQRESKYVYGVASSISLGLMFGAVPALGWLLGLDLEVRHMTLSAGALVLGICSLGFRGALSAGLPAAALGLMIVTTLNIGVAFVLGFFAAAHASGLERSVVAKLIRATEFPELLSPLL